MAPKNDDPVEKVRQIVRETMQGILEERDRGEREKSDPWERMRGIIRSEVRASLDDLLGDLPDDDEGEGDEQGQGRRQNGRGSRGNRRQDDDGPLALFGS